MTIRAMRQRLGDDVIGRAHGLKIDALARLGQLLDATPKNKGGGEPGIGRRGKNAVPDGNHITTPTYAELGIGKKEAATAQQLAGMPIDVRPAIPGSLVKRRERYEP